MQNIIGFDSYGLYTSNSCEEFEKNLKYMKFSQYFLECFRKLSKIYKMPENKKIMETFRKYI